MLCPCTYIYCSDGSIFFIINQPGRNQGEKKKWGKLWFTCGFLLPRLQTLKLKGLERERLLLFSHWVKKGSLFWGSIYCLPCFVWFPFSPSSSKYLHWSSLFSFSFSTHQHRWFDYRGPVNGIAKLTVANCPSLFFFWEGWNRNLYRWTARITDGTYSTTL